MKSRKKKTLPVRAKRYNKKKSENFGYDNLEPRQLLAADFLSAVNYVGSDQIRLTEPVAVTEGVEILRHQLELGNNESLKLQNSTTDRLGQQHLKYQQYYNDMFKILKSLECQAIKLRLSLQLIKFR
jgi:Zn-dependent metalloprotease